MYSQLQLGTVGPSQIHMKITTSESGSSYDPDAFGPAFWFTLHNSSTTYPNNPTDVVRHKMKQFLTALPLLVPCVSCREHFYSFIQQTDLDKVVSSRESLFEFFVNVHNYVNRRYGKSEMSLDHAKKLYGFDKQGVGSTIRITYSHN